MTMKRLPWKWAWLVVALGACSSQEEGIGLDLAFSLEAPGESVNGVTLTRATLSVVSVEIFSCPTTARRWDWSWLSPIGTAHAHVEGTPTLYGEPILLGLETDGGGRLTPPPGEYCRARVAVGPADADTQGLPSDLLGKSWILEGTHRPAGAEADVPFRLESEAFRLLDVALPRVALDAERRSDARTFSWNVSQWFPETFDPTPPTAGDAVNAALGPSLQVREGSAR